MGKGRRTYEEKGLAVDTAHGQAVSSACSWRGESPNHNLEDLSTEATEALKKLRKRKRVLAIVIPVLAVLLGTAIAFEYVPDSPYVRTFRNLIDPPVPVETVGLGSCGVEIDKPLKHTVEVGIVLDVPELWKSQTEEVTERHEEPIGEGSGSEEGSADDSVAAEPTPAEKLEALKAEAFKAIEEGRLATSGISIAMTLEDEEGDDERAFGYEPSSREELVGRHSEELRAERYGAMTVNLPSPFETMAMNLESGFYSAYATEYLFDEYGFIWKTDATSTCPLHPEITESTISYQIDYYPVDLAALSEDEYSALLAQAGEFADAVAEVRAMATWQPDGDTESPAPDDDGGDAAVPANPGSQGGTHSGGNASGNTNPEGNSGNGNQSGTTTPTDPNPPSPGHTHTTATRDVYIGTQDVTVVDVPGHMGTVHHDAVYNDWSEPITVCNDCGAVITHHEDEHMMASGGACRSWHSEHIYHHDLVSEAWDEETWIPDQSHTVTYAMYVTETYCLSCGEVLSTSAPWHY